MGSLGVEPSVTDYESVAQTAEHTALNINFISSSDSEVWNFQVIFPVRSSKQATILDLLGLPCRYNMEAVQNQRT